ncbi:MAG: HAMP domain-containing histidine kinase [Clostridium sp.]|nr:HAMP domain-containing histidine kinase [Clostridium sp.]MCM1459119.1 HAMP domain-containing histidine kinase [Bacteroides sp.]
MKKKNHKILLHSIWSFLVFFLLTAFSVTCCMLLFLSVLSSKMGLQLTRENINVAAKLTFGNVLLLTVVFVLIDGIRRRLTVERPVKKIVQAAEQIMQGDFTVRIEANGGLRRDDAFNRIIACFNKMAEELSGIETLRADFVANVSHEIKTPLAVIQNYAMLLSQRELQEEKKHEYTKAIMDATHRLSDLISNILKLNKLENQQIFPQLEVYDLGEQLCECLLDFENLWEEKELELKTDISDNIQVRADKEMVKLVWNNLFSNAIKFTEQGGLLALSLHAENETAVVTVRDTGCGISKETGTHIFDKFYQGDTSHASQGNGLGLALVKRIIDIMGCEISVSSEVGKGSTFTVKMRRITNGKTEENSA